MNIQIHLLKERMRYIEEELRLMRQVAALKAIMKERFANI